MREIKFRAWNKVWKMMLPVARLEFECDVQSLMVYNKATDGLHEEWEDEVIGEDVFLMQFTGLLDRHGKEIYEGDIIECKQGEFKKTGKVNFVQGMFNWEYEEGKISWLSEVVKKWKGEVIGNIYENPELI